MSKHAIEGTLEWMWRIAALIIVPMLVWVALTLRDVDQRVGVLEAQVRAHQIAIQSTGFELSAHMEWGRERSETLATETARLTEAVNSLKPRLDRLNARLDRMER